jgi:hypothetical protein
MISSDPVESRSSIQGVGWRPHLSSINSMTPATCRKAHIYLRHADDA